MRIYYIMCAASKNSDSRPAGTHLEVEGVPAGAGGAELGQLCVRVTVAVAPTERPCHSLVALWSSDTWTV